MCGPPSQRAELLSDETEFAAARPHSSSRRGWTPGDAVARLSVMGRLLVLGCVVLAVTVAPTTGIAAAHHTQTCHAKALAVTFTLPSDWLCAEGAPGSSIRYAGIAPAKT